MSVLPRTLRHTGLFVLTGCAVATIACGLSAVGTNDVSEVEAGVDATVDHTAHLPGEGDDDGSIDTPADGSVEDGGVDADAAPLDASDAADVDAAAPCPEPSGVIFGGHCYFRLNGNSQTASSLACITAGAHLVTVNSTDEQTFLSGSQLGDTTTSRWMGLTTLMQTTDPTKFTWMTGEPVTVQFWSTVGPQPNADGTCAVLQKDDSKWADRDCGESLPAICERE